MWTDADIDYWVTRLFAAKDSSYVAARIILLEVRDQIGEATITEAHKQKRARYLMRKAERKAGRKNEIAETVNEP
jgi:hypothetical protein